jgi:hypothetical protein
MNKYVAIFVPIGVIAAVGITIASSYIGAYNKGNRLEQQLEATWENNENILAQYGQKVQEAAQVPGMRADDLTKILTAAFSGGSDAAQTGTQAIFGLMAANGAAAPAAGDQMYVQIQRIIEAGRNDFQLAQTKLVDTKRLYKTELGSFWSGMWLGIAGYPKVDLDKYTVITTGRARNAFQSGVEESPLKLRKD